MSLIDRSDLKYDYTWSAKPGQEPRSGTTTKDTSKPTVFRPDEGDQVLTFLNGYAKSRNISNKKVIHKLESLLQKKRKGGDGVTIQEIEEWFDKERKK